ncbi:ParB N-terminal domain-containing protein [Pseudonocardia spinosispora]|uniref:ParB N-terminal domain-containing protein n=1 Tax=Pseudonocardia spinosispora TaxID=103441 RepID=UPI00041B6ED7|nr:ParB N-terminal domain-containing protein [Pseudonocardia spinosispora]
MELVYPTRRVRPVVLRPAAAEPTDAVVALEINSLNAGYSLRASVPNAEHVLLLAGARRPLPPVIVHRAGMRVIDGMHRIRAAALRGDTMIAAHLFDGSEDDAFLLAVRSNVGHGLPLTLAERKAAALRILTAHPEWSDRAIAVTTGLSDKTVASIRRQASADLPRSTARLGADGRLRPLDGDHRRRLAAELVATQPRASLREIADVVGMSLGTVRDVRTRMSRGEDPVPTRRRAEVPRPSAGVPAAPEVSEQSDTGAREIRQLVTTLERLRDDPSLRFSASGRHTVRWLYARMVGLDQWDELVEAIPPHWAEVVADLARDCADSWRDFATACDRRARRAG